MGGFIYKCCPCLKTDKPNKPLVRGQWSKKNPTNQLDQTSQPFFQGQILKKRLDELRKRFIQPIRQNYNKQLFNKLKQQFISMLEDDDQSQIQLMSNIKYRYWDDKLDQITNQTKIFTLLTAFTNDKINKFIIRPKLNNILRKQPLPSQEFLQTAIFLLEAINIELFLATVHFPQLNNFQGEVFRGFDCSKEDFQKFRLTLDKPLQDRIISVPLSLWSASISEEVAINFLKNQPQTIKIVLDIHIVEMIPKQLAIYKKRYPQNIVSTICAVNIAKFSQFNESQVLLRGAFCLVLNIIEKQAVNRQNEKIKFYKIECVMANGNRDHISTNYLKQKATPARNEFGSIAKLSRMNFAIEYLKKNQKKQQLNYFQNKIIQQNQKLAQMRKD